MAKIKHTKNELKAQREALTRFERFLPMLLLKKQQLQAEIQAITTRIAEKEAREGSLRSDLDSWIALLAEPVGVDDLVVLEEVVADVGNIAGVTIPVFKEARVRRQEYDLFATPTWVDDAADTLGQLIALRVEREMLEEQRVLIAEELRVTNQRVNLFEKVKIPECREHIRIIRIFLGDEQTAGVARAKIAKSKTQDHGQEENAA